MSMPATEAHAPSVSANSGGCCSFAARGLDAPLLPRWNAWCPTPCITSQYALTWEQQWLGFSAELCKDASPTLSNKPSFVHLLSHYALMPCHNRDFGLLPSAQGNSTGGPPLFGAYLKRHQALGMDLTSFLILDPSISLPRWRKWIEIGSWNCLILMSGPVAYMISA